MKIIKALFATLIILALLAGLVLGGYYAIKFGVDAVARMDYQTTIISTILIVTLFAVVLVSRGLRRISRRHQANLLHNEKAATYQLFTEVWSHGPRSIIGNQDPPEELRALDRLLSLYSSPSVMKAYVAFRHTAQSGDAFESTAWSQLAKVVWEMRRDLGLATDSLTLIEVQQLLGAELNARETNVPSSSYPDRRPRMAVAAKS